MLPTYSTTRHAPETRSPGQASSRLETARRGIQGLFTGRSSVGRPRRSSIQVPESPKTPRPIPTPRPVLALRNMPTTRLAIPYISRSRSDARSYSRSESRSYSRTESRTHSRTESTHPAVSSSPSPRSPHFDNIPPSSQPIRTDSWHRQVQQQDISTPRHHGRQNSSQRFVGVDPAEQHLAQLAETGRRRRRNKHRTSKSQRRCAPKMKNRKIRSKVLSCFVSAMVRFILKRQYKLKLTMN